MAISTRRRDAGLAPWQIIWRDRVEKARELVAVGRGELRDDWNFSADEILAIDADRRAMTDLWAKHGSRADRLAALLREAINCGAFDDAPLLLKDVRAALANTQKASKDKQEEKA